MILRARYILPVSRPPIENGAILLSKSRIAKVGRYTDLKDLSRRKIDLGEVILMPGLINSHCHLDYTDMAGLIPPSKVFTDWIRQIVTIKGQWNSEDYSSSWQKGARMLLKTGTTTVADIEAAPELLPKAWDATALRVFSFLEMIGISRTRTPEETFAEVRNQVTSLKHKRCTIGLSPHAPYSTVPNLLKLAGTFARGKRMLVSTHIAESRLEYRMFTRGAGEMHDWLAKSGRDMTDCGGVTPVRHMARNGLLGRNLLAIHLNYVTDEDVDLLASKNVSAVHCPRSHFYFRHQRFPFEKMKKAGVNICLGTDSLASVFRKRGEKVRLDMFEEMRTLARLETSLEPEQILRMATVNGARALRQSGVLGELKPRARADLIGVPFNGKSLDLYESVLSNESGVAFSMINGNWAIEPRQAP
jgi:cytosine/adenosine deaminase-related metal-dependent hydrolase